MPHDLNVSMETQMIRPSIASLAAGVFSLCVVLGSHALAQHQGHQPSQPSSAYRGMEARSIKALSEAQIADLKSGRGMGLALAAELNGNPGPMHVLELADNLTLTPDQRIRMEDMVHAMKQETIGIGEDVIMAERAKPSEGAESRHSAGTGPGGSFRRGSSVTPAALRLR